MREGNFKKIIEALVSLPQRMLGNRVHSSLLRRRLGSTQEFPCDGVARVAEGPPWRCGGDPAGRAAPERPGKTGARGRAVRAVAKKTGVPRARRDSGGTHGLERILQVVISRCGRRSLRESGARERRPRPPQPTRVLETPGRERPTAHAPCHPVGGHLEAPRPRLQLRAGSGSYRCQAPVVVSLRLSRVLFPPVPALSSAQYTLLRPSLSHELVFEFPGIMWSFARKAPTTATPTGLDCQKRLLHLQRTLVWFPITYRVTYNSE